MFSYAQMSWSGAGMVAAMGALMAASGIDAASGQLCEQYLGLLQVGGVKPLGEPLIDRRE
jgi:hypothetical protein